MHVHHMMMAGWPGFLNLSAASRRRFATCRDSPTRRTASTHRRRRRSRRSRRNRRRPRHLRAVPTRLDGFKGIRADRST